MMMSLMANAVHGIVKWFVIWIVFDRLGHGV